MPKPKSAASLIGKTKKDMQALQIYKPEFDPIIRIYCGLFRQYEALTDQYINENMQFEVTTSQGVKKSPLVTTLESLRKDIAAYAVQLGLTPSGLKRINEDANKPKKKVSKFESVLNEFEKGTQKRKKL